MKLVHIFFTLNSWYQLIVNLKKNSRYNRSHAIIMRLLNSTNIKFGFEAACTIFRPFPAVLLANVCYFYIIF